ncbi:hypothetical protein BN970_01365 [Mycolicibacterium conceptionense]|nr:hypothetical protein [Mycolicibacterium conceptionense]CQD07255.1 hypothetical protein BN970_01365 [Mycolicibacterium conceptionense]
MSENITAGSESGTAEQVSATEPEQPKELPADHPLVKKLEIQKAEIKDLKGKAAQLAAIEEAQKSDAEKAADRIAKAEAESASVPAKVAAALKEHLVGLHQIDADDAELFLTAEEPDVLLKQVTRLLDRSDKRRNKNHVAREGENPTATASEEATFARDFFSSQ